MAGPPRGSVSVNSKAPSDSVVAWPSWVVAPSRSVRRIRICRPPGDSGPGRYDRARQNDLVTFVDRLRPRHGHARCLAVHLDRDLFICWATDGVAIEQGRDRGRPSPSRGVADVDRPFGVSRERTDTGAPDPHGHGLVRHGTALVGQGDGDLHRRSDRSRGDRRDSHRRADPVETDYAFDLGGTPVRAPRGTHAVRVRVALARVPRDRERAVAGGRRATSETLRGKASTLFVEFDPGTSKRLPLVGHSSGKGDRLIWRDALGCGHLEQGRRIGDIAAKICRDRSLVARGRDAGHPDDLSVPGRSEVERPVADVIRRRGAEDGVTVLADRDVLSSDRRLAVTEVSLQVHFLAALDQRASVDRQGSHIRGGLLHAVQPGPVSHHRQRCPIQVDLGHRVIRLGTEGQNLSGLASRRIQVGHAPVLPTGYLVRTHRNVTVRPVVGGGRRHA